MEGKMTETKKKERRYKDNIKKKCKKSKNMMKNEGKDE